MASYNREYLGNNSQSEVSEEEENGWNDEDEEDVVEMGADDDDLSAYLGAQWPMGMSFLAPNHR